MGRTIMMNRIKQLPKGMKWRIGVMLVWLALFIMGFNDFYVRNAALDALWFIGVILFIILFRRYHRGHVHMSDSYSRSDDMPSFCQRYPYRPTGSNYGGEFPSSASDILSTSFVSYTPTYSCSSSSSSIHSESSYDSYQSSSSFHDTSYHDTNHEFRNDF